MSRTEVQDPLPLPAFQAHSTTSRDAAVSVREDVPTRRERVFKAISQSSVGLTDLEIGAVLNMSGDSVRPRRVELVGDGRIVSAGTRLTPSGRKAVVWTARRDR